MNELRKEFNFWLDENPTKTVWLWIEQKLKEARLDELNRIHHSSEIPLLKYVNNRISELEK